MGILRFLLAISVLILHTSPILGLTMVGGDVAVQAFYMISGFYMSLVLADKYETSNWKGYKLFITNRLLKLYPVYWLTLIAIILLGIISLILFKSTYVFDYYLNHKEILTPFNLTYFIISNLIIIGQDVLFFIGYSKIGYYFQTDYSNAEISLHRFLFMKQAWTISLEIYFYMLVPFLNRLSSKKLVIITLVLFIIRFSLYSQSITYQPWSYQFFPFELAFFLIGLLAHRYYTTSWMSHNKSLAIVVMILLVMLTLFFQFLGHDTLLKKYIYLSIFACTIPFLFEATKSNKIDRIIGETSYPIYIIHGLIGLILVVLFPNIGGKLGLANLLISFVFAVLFNQIVFKFIEGYRQKRIKPKS